MNYDPATNGIVSTATAGCDWNGEEIVQLARMKKH